MPSVAALGNPVDLIASATSDQYAKTIEALLSAEEIDALIVLYISVMVTDTAEIVQGILTGIENGRKAGAKAKPVLINQVQVHPVSRRPIHADLFIVNMTEELTVDVPLVATGESTAVTQLGGTLLHPTETVKVKGLPDHLPQSIEYSIESLVDFEGTIHVRDLAILRGIVARGLGVR